MSDEVLLETPLDDSYSDVLDTAQALQGAQVQLESLLTATESLESLVRHLDTHSIDSDAHRDAVVVSVESLLAGTGLAVDEFVPELDGVVSTESLKDRLKELWKRLVNMVLTVLRMIRSYWQKVATYRGQLRLAAGVLDKRAAAKRLATVRMPNIDLGMEIKTFVVGGNVVTDPDALIRSISAALDQYKILTTHYGKRTLELGKAFESLLQNSATGADMLNQVNRLFTEQLPFEEVASKVKAMAYRDPRFGRRLALAAPATLGGWSLFILLLEDAQRAKIDSDPIAYAQALRTTGVKFVLSNVNISNITQGTVRTASGMQVQSLAKRVIEILDLIDAQERVMVSNRIENQVKNVLKAGERYQSSLGGSGTVYDESVLRFVRNYSNWAFGPVDQMTTNLLTVSRNLLTYGRKSLVTY